MIEPGMSHFDVFRGVEKNIFLVCSNFGTSGSFNIKKPLSNYYFSKSFNHLYLAEWTT